VTLIIFFDDFTHNYFFPLNLLLTHKTKKRMTTKHEKKIHLSDLHFENETWLNEIDFLKQEMNLFENKLPQLLVANAGNQERIAKIEQFQNQFIRQREQLGELRHIVHLSEQLLAQKAKEMNPAEVMHKNLAGHSELREKVESYKYIYSNFKRKFFDFIIHWK
jgi:hypothetical protein